MKKCGKEIGVDAFLYYVLHGTILNVGLFWQMPSTINLTHNEHNVICGFKMNLVDDIDHERIEPFRKLMSQNVTIFWIGMMKIGRVRDEVIRSLFLSEAQRSGV
jgi:hypothetical protein